MSSIYADQGTAAHAVLEECLEYIYDLGFDRSPDEYVGQAILVEDGFHSLRSPSGAKRWMHCNASVQAAKDYPEQLGLPREVIFTEEDARAVKQALEYVAQRITDIQLRADVDEVEVLTERRVSLASILGHEECDGTADVTLLGYEHVGPIRHLRYVEIVDYKHGAGVPVDVDDPQVWIYWLGAVAENAEGIWPNAGRTTIVQPRCDKVEPRIRWLDIKDAQAFGTERISELREVDRKMYQGAPEIHHEPGDWCRFCPIGGDGGQGDRPVCSAYTRYAMAAMGIVDEEEPLPENGSSIADQALNFAGRDFSQLTPEQVLGILQARDAIKGALEAVEARAFSLLHTAKPPAALAARYKLVERQTRRKWSQGEEEITKALRKIKIMDPDKGKERPLGLGDITEKKLKSPAAIERVLLAADTDKESTRWLALQSLITKPEGALVVAPVQDPRPAWEPDTSVEDFFDDIDL